MPHYLPPNPRPTSPRLTAPRLSADVGLYELLRQGIEGLLPTAPDVMAMIDRMEQPA